MTAGKDAPTFGEAKNSWLTGSAAWTFVSISQAILGIKPSYNGLVIDPCIPRNWEKYHIIRLFRGVKYDITIQNPDKVSKEVKKLMVNGEVISGNLIPFKEGTGEIKVEVVLGN
jgi:cellobiose phosphorylase